MIGESHLSGGKSADATEGVEAEDGGKVVLPGADVEAEILYGRRRSDGVAPR
jgi:hypothetical protein